MTPKLYMIELSPPVRAVLMTAKMLGITLELKHVDITRKEQLAPEYLKMNPQHTVPTLDDRGFIIWDSHAIMAYLVGKYGQDHTLYPKDPFEKAIIDQRLHFESGVMFASILNILRPIILYGERSIPQERIEMVNQAYSYLEKFLENHKWIAGDNVTIADFSLISSVTNANILVPIDAKKYPKVVAWIENAESWPFYKEINEKGLCNFRNSVCRVLSIK